jgi:putative component of toxin-antitoxin plasmid stabilization module
MGTAEIIVLIMLTVWSVLMIIAGFDKVKQVEKLEEAIELIKQLKTK